MSDLSQDQLDKRAAIQKSATIIGVIAGAVVGLLAVWLLGAQGAALRFGGAIVLGLGVGYLAYSAHFKSAAKTAACAKCGATFSRSRSDHAETLTSSTPKETREEQPDKSTKVTTWIEDSFDVVDTYACAKCGDVTTNDYKTTRRRDETSVIEPFVAPEATTKKGAAAKGPAVRSGSGKSGRSGRSGSRRS